MTRQTTIDKLHAMRLKAMADAFEMQCDNSFYSDLSFEDRIGIIVDKEWDRRQNNKLMKLMRKAHFRYPNACMEDIEYIADRKLDRSLLTELAAGVYISEKRHIILMGAAGSGKTYIACALGMAACRDYKKVCYIRLPELLNELAIAHGEGTFLKAIKNYRDVELLILDDFLITPLNDEQSRDLLEIIEVRSTESSTIFCTQFEIGDWYERLGGEYNATVTESIVDRVKHNSYKILIEGRISMRERHGWQSKEGDCHE